MGELFGFKYHSECGFIYEVSRYFIIKSIEIAEETKDDNYYCDWYKLHKLMYYGQVVMLCKFGDNLFVGDITAHDCGPMVEGIDSVAKQYGFKPIKKILPDDVAVMKYYNLIFSKEQLMVMDNVIKYYGGLNRDKIIDLARKDILWNDVYNTEKNDIVKHPIITENKMVDYYQSVLPRDFAYKNEPSKMLRITQRGQQWNTFQD